MGDLFGKYKMSSLPTPSATKRADPDDPATIGISPARTGEYRRILSKLGRGALRFEPSLGSAGIDRLNI
jgi:hypothetical protein